MDIQTLYVEMVTSIDNQGADLLKVSFLNLNSIVVDNFSKLDELQLFLDSTSIDIMGLGETKLNCDIADNEIKIDNYMLERNDFSRHRSGVALYIKSNIEFQRMLDIEGNMNDCIWIKISNSTSNALIAFYYRNFSQTVDEFQLFVRSFTNCLTKAKKLDLPIIILGDFNVHNKSWDPLDFTTSKGREIKNTFDSFNLDQLNTQHTYFSGSRSSLLDLILTDNRNLIKKTLVENFMLEKHCAISCWLDMSVNKNAQKILRKVYNFNKAKYNLMHNYINFHLRNLDFNQNVNILAEKFNQILIDSTDKYVPHYTIRSKKYIKPWMNDQIFIKMKHRDALFKKYLKDRTEMNFSAYKNSRILVTSLIKKAKQQYLVDLSSKLSQGCTTNKNWHKLVNQFIHTRNTSRYPPIKYHNKMHCDPLQKAYAFNDHFKSISVVKDSDKKKLPEFKVTTSCQLSDIHIDEQLVLRELEALDCSKSIGPDKISPHVLKNCRLTIAPYLTRLFSKITSTGIFPVCWKIAHVTPIFKTGDPTDPANYRPISITSVVSKILERIIHTQIYQYVIINNLISHNQSGFIKSDSCVNRLFYFVQKVNEALNNKMQVATIFLDIKKAFDKVWHKGLLFKLKRIGINGKLLDLLSSYLGQRCQRVVIDGVTSDIAFLSAGVPQGGVLSTLLFIIFIDDITEGLLSQVSLFADDTTLYNIISSSNDENLSLMQADLSTIEKWAFKWLVEFNASKCKCMVFCRKNCDSLNPHFTFFNMDIQVVQQFQYLGVTLDNKLTWTPHIDGLHQKTQMLLNLMKQYKYIFKRHTLKLIYIYHIKSIIDYADILLSGLTVHQSKRIENLQYKAMLTVSGAHYGTSETKMIHEDGLALNNIVLCTELL